MRAREKPRHALFNGSLQVDFVSSQAIYAHASRPWPFGCVVQGRGKSGARFCLWSRQEADRGGKRLAFHAVREGARERERERE